jgi:hypothetical protein
MTSMRLLLVPFQIATIALGIEMVRIWVLFPDLNWIHYVLMSCIWAFLVILIGVITKEAYTK